MECSVINRDFADNKIRHFQSILAIKNPPLSPGMAYSKSELCRQPDVTYWYNYLSWMFALSWGQLVIFFPWKSFSRHPSLYLECIWKDGSFYLWEWVDYIYCNRIHELAAYPRTNHLPLKIEQMHICIPYGIQLPGDVAVPSILLNPSGGVHWKPRLLDGRWIWQNTVTHMSALLPLRDQFICHTTHIGKYEPGTLSKKTIWIWPVCERQFLSNLWYFMQIKRHPWKITGVFEFRNVV